ncbi:MAG: hypothetical protein Q7S39_01870 [Ignavibacteria bacterium]|nr:hypothetical protein [Ignavibacteria bacterium]
MLRFFIFYSIIILILNGCDDGIEPQPENKQTGFGGKITFIGQWPDSVTRAHLVVFKDPLNSVGDFSPANLRFVSQEIPKDSIEYNYSSLDSTVVLGGEFMPGDYAYVAVAQSSKQDVSLNRADWFVVGLYYNVGDTTKPGMLHIPENTFVDNINIVCDFNNPPPQPPGGN